MSTKSSIVRPALLSDKLIDAVDRVRRIVHAKLGTRPWRVDIVTRRWSGEGRGVGTPSYEVLTLDPVPCVERSTKNRLGPGGQESTGSVTLTGVSLRYSEAQLAPLVDQRTEVAYRLVEIHGQKQTTTWLVLNGDPIPRRGDKPGDSTDWKLTLNETSAMGGMDGVDAP